MINSLDLDFRDTDPEKVGSQSRKEATLENQNEDRSNSRRRQQKSVHENDSAAEMLSKLVQQQSAPQVDMELFEGNPLDFLHTSCQCFKSQLRRR